MSQDGAEGSFGRSAQRVSGHAALLLGWLPEVFWNATPAELAAVLMARTGNADSATAPSRDEIQRMLAGDPDGPLA